MAVAFVTWLWGNKYNESHVARLAAGIRRHHRGDYRLVVFADRALKNQPDELEVRLIANPELIGHGCFCRLRMFDPIWQMQHGFDDRLVSLDLDLVITGAIEPLFSHSDSFLILQGVNALNPNPFNGSVMLLRAGQHADVWSDFTLEKAASVPFHSFPDDQGWIWHKLPDARGWLGGKASGIYAFEKPGWPTATGRTVLPPNARIVVFIGWRKPDLFRHIPWVKANWRT